MPDKIHEVVQELTAEVLAVATKPCTRLIRFGPAPSGVGMLIPDRSLVKEGGGWMPCVWTAQLAHLEG